MKQLAKPCCFAAKLWWVKLKLFGSREHSLVVIFRSRLDLLFLNLSYVEFFTDKQIPVK